MTSTAAPTVRLPIDADLANAEGGRDYLAGFVGMVVAFTTYEGEQRVGIVETMTAADQPWGAPVIRFADGKWARGDLDHVDAVDSPDAALRALAAAIGGGFHPDTRGDGYTSLPTGVTPERYEAIVEAAFAADVDVYGVALDVIHSA